MDCNEFETVFGYDFYCSLDVIDCHQGHPIRHIEHEEPFALIRARS